MLFWKVVVHQNREFSSEFYETFSKSCEHRLIEFPPSESNTQRPNSVWKGLCAKFLYWVCINIFIQSSKGNGASQI